MVLLNTVGQAERLTVCCSERAGPFPFTAEAVSLSIGVNLVSEAVECFPGSPRPAASSGARCTLLIILSTSSIQTYSGNTRPLIARDPFFTYCCTSSARPARMWLTFFMVGGERKIKQTEQHIKPDGILPLEDTISFKGV